MNSGLSAGTFSAQSLANPLSPALTAFLLPHASFALPQSGASLAEQPNVKGALVSLTALAVGAEIGVMSDRVALANPQNYNSLTSQQASLLASATREDVLGVQYALYRYLGSAESNVVLKNENFSLASRWQRLTANISTGASDSAPIVRTVSTGQRVLVEFNASDYGLYEYRGASGSMNLVTQNYRDGARWLKLVGAAATDGPLANLTNGMLVTSKFTIDALTIRRVDDINVEATNSIIAFANNRVALESSGDARLQRVVAGNDVQITSAANIVDVGIGSAAIATGNQLRMQALSILGTDPGLPLRTQVVPTGSLEARTTADMTIRQIATDTTINGVAQAINNLFVARAASSGPMKITVDEGDMSLGVLTSTYTVDLTAAGSILDAYPDALGRPVNIATTAAGGPATGNVWLTAGATIGTTANPLDIALAGSELRSQSVSHTTIHNVGDLLARQMTSIGGNVTIFSDGVLSIDKIQALQGNVTITSQLSVLDVNGDAASDIDAIQISITVINGSIGETTDDLEIDTANTTASSFFAQASGNIFATETAGRLNVTQVSSTTRGDIRLATTDSSATGEDINTLANSIISAIDGTIQLLGGDNLSLAGAVSARDVMVRGDYRNRDTEGSTIAISGNWTTSSAEITTDNDNDVVLIAAAMSIGFVVRVAKGDDDVTTGAGSDFVYGGPGVDILRGGDGDDQLDAGTGIGDQLYGGIGNDRIYGSDEGSESDPDFADGTRFGDFVDAGEGDDQVWTYGGADYVLGGLGSDLIMSGAGSDRVLAGAGNDTVYSGLGLADWVEGAQGDDLIYGSNVGSDTLLGQEGQDRIYGLGGSDTIDGGLANDWIDGGAGADTIDGSEGDDYLDGSFGTDIVRGGIGNDEIYGGGGAGDQLLGGDGDDIVRGSNDGPDTIDGGAGKDRLFGFGGNDFMRGGSGDDIIEGGDGDDIIYGDAGSDLLVGGAQHDVIYSLNPAGTGADNAVDYAYGDFGTEGNEPGSGRDQLVGSGGTDMLFGEGDDDRITITNPATFVYYGSGESAVPFDFVTPTPTPNPSVLPDGPAAHELGAASLPTGAVDRGLWSELSGSATGLGIAGDSSSSMDYAVVSTANGPVVVWADGRSGNQEIYAAQHKAGAWSEMATSASRGGVSNTSGRSSSPSLALVGGKPTIAWTETVGATSHIRVAQFDEAAPGGAAWLALGSSLDATGISGAGVADKARLINSSFGPVVAWLQEVGGTRQVYAKLWNGAAWVAVGVGSDIGGGISNAPVGSQIDQLQLAEKTGRLAVAYTIVDGSGLRQVHLKQYDGTTWSAIAGSDTGSGVSGAAAALFQAPLTHSTTPSITYLGDDLFVSWQTFADQSSTLVVAKYTAAAGAPSTVFQRTVASRDVQSRLVAGGGALRLLWLEGYDRLAALKWNGTAMVEEIPGDIDAHGVFNAGRGAASMAVSVNAAGQPTVVWEEVVGGRAVLKLRTQGTALSGRVFTASPAGSSIQQLLDSNVLVDGDVILVSGVVNGDVTLTAADAGVTILGAPQSQINGNITVTGNGVTLQRLNLTGSVTVNSASNFSLRDTTMTGSVTLNGGSAAQLSFNRITGRLLLVGNASGAIIRNNAVIGSTFAVAIGDPAAVLTGGVTNLQLLNNTLSGAMGIRGLVASTVAIRGNSVTATNTALEINASLTGAIESNRLQGGALGVRYAAAADLNDNDIVGNSIGVIVLVDSTTTGLGYMPGARANRISGNNVGVELTGRMQGQRIFSNTTGVTGSGSLVSSSLDAANVIENNTTGVSITGSIQFQLIHRNGTGIAAVNNQLIANNILAGNTIGIAVTGRNNTRIVANTITTPIGDNVRVTSSSRETELRNNILWTASGYDIYVANDSTTGFFSDYNALYTTGSGKIGFWTKDFTDILDWQQDIYQFDLNSIGTTAVNPRDAEPQFFSVARDDFRVFTTTARQRLSSPTVDRADVLNDLALPPGYSNLLTNASFESELTGWTATPSGLADASGPAPFDGATYFNAGPNPTTTLTQTVNLLAAGYTAGQLDSHSLLAAFGGRVRVASEDPRDRGTLTVTMLDAGGATIGQPSVIRASSTINRWELIGDHVTLPVGVRSIRYQFEAVRQSGGTNDVYLDRTFLSILPGTFAPDQGAYSHTAGDLSTPARLRLISPDLYTDWELNKPIDIRWDSFGNTAGAPVVIELLRDTPTGPQFVTHVTTGTDDDGVFTWIAGNTLLGAVPAMDFGTYGWRLAISLGNNPTVNDRSSETFSVPENTNTFFVNDTITTGDQFTSAVGSNRNTGKVAGAPKPYPNNVLRIYSLGANQTLSVDTGTYALLSPLLVSNILGIGDDEGFVMRGSSTGITRLQHANSLTVAPIIELNNADFVTLNNMTLAAGTLGLWARNQSTNLAASGLVAINNTQGGIRVEGSSSVLGFNNMRADNNTGVGIYVSGAMGSLTNSILSNNRSHGAQLIDSGATQVEGNVVSNNTGNNIFGLYMSNTLGGSPLVVGNSNLTLGKGNIVRDNTHGVFAWGNVSVAGNTVYNQTSGTGISLNNGATATANVVFDNSVGIFTSSGEVRDNRVYHNSDAGVVADGSPLITRNVIYSNPTGIRGNFAFAGTLANNLIYANSLAGFTVSTGSYYGGNVTLVNNTFAQTSGDAIRATSTSRNLRLRNNILWVSGGYGINVSPDSQVGFQSDYNNFYVTGTGKVASWQNVDRNSLAAWRSTAFTDANSLNVDPRFVDMDGADNMLGYISAAADGRDDDFHLASIHGSFIGASFAPVASAGGTGLPVSLPNGGAVPVPGIHSQLIDRGDAADPVGAEPAPNGSYINIGGYGGTSQASLSPAEYVTVTNPDGSEIWPQEQTFNIRWRSSASASTFTIDLMRQGNSTPIATLSNNAPGTGTYAWTIPASVPSANDYLIRVTRNDGSGLFDLSDQPFSIRTPISVYYVNDGTVAAGDLTTAVGNDANSGLGPDSPKASISAVLNAFVMKPGDTIFVDAGTYTLSTTLVLTAAAKGISIVGYSDPAFPTRSTILNRNNTSFNVIELQNADDITLDRLTITGGSRGVSAISTSDSDRLTVTNSQFTGNSSAGIWLETSNDFVTVQGSTFSNTSSNYGALLYGSDSVVSTNTFTGIGIQALEVDGPRSLVSNNTFTSVRRGVYANNQSGTPADRITVRDNVVTGATEWGIGSSGNVLITGNTVIGAATGVTSHGEVRGNTVSDGGRGVWMGSSGVAENNVIYHNTEIGLFMSNSATTRNNRVYDNNVGIQFDFGTAMTISNNFVYNNTTAGILASDAGYYGGTPTVSNNTIIQPLGDAVRVVGGGSQNVLVENNILQVGSGYAINVDSNASRGFRSDYNVIHTTGTGKIGLWEGQTFTNRADWFYEAGLDEHSTFADPQFVDLDGPDNVLGFSRGRGLQAAYYPTNDLSGSPFVTRIDTTVNFAVGGGTPVTGLPADNFSIRWDGFIFIPTVGSYTFYETSDDGMRLYLSGSSTPVIDQWTYVGGAERTYTTSFASIGWVPIRIEHRETTGSASLTFNWSGPGIARQVVPTEYFSPTLLPSFGNYGSDDNFAVLSTSPSIDAGDPAELYYREPMPNGGRINAGGSGNTTLAEISALQNMQVVSPNGLEKYEQGQTVSIDLRSHGLLPAQPVMLLNGGNTAVGVWSAGNAFQTSGLVSSVNNEFVTATIDRSAVTDPIPEQLYRSYLQSNFGVGNTLSLKLPVSDGTYSVRLHFIEGSQTAVGARRFDIRINGATVRANYDILATAGVRFKAVAESFTGMVASAGGGLSIDLVNLTGPQAILAAVEIFTATPQGTATPTAALELSSDGGTNWSPIAGAGAVTFDRWGTSTFNWTIPANQAQGNNYRIRARATASTGEISDTSNASFIVANAGTDYYVNDDSLVGDVFTSAVGNNAASGKSPDQPLESLTALLAAYTFGPGDVIHVDAGSYQLIKSIVLTTAHTGLRIEGPSTGVATLNRNNPSFNVIELQNADDITLDRLTITGGSRGVSAISTSDSDRLTVTNSQFTGNSSAGIWLETSNDFVTVQGSTFSNTSSNYGALLYGSDSVVSTNTFTGIGIQALEVDGPRSLVSNNTFTSVRRGVYANNQSGTPADRITVRDNVVTGATEWGIGSSGNVLITGNTVIGAATGVTSHGEVRGNTVSDGGRGVWMGSSGVAENNVIYHNTEIGLFMSNSATTRNNRVYDNNVGIQFDFGTAMTISNNFVYNNTTAGILASDAGYYGGTPTVSNNTIIQPLGDAVRVVGGGSQNVLVENNILQVGSGYAINVDSNASRGFRSDYNVIHTTGTGKIGLWEGQTFTNRADWFYEAGLDEHSTFADPQFVDLDGPDNVLGFSRGRGLQAAYYPTNDLSGSPFVTRIDTTVNFAVGGGTPVTGLPADNFSIRWDGFIFIPTVGSYTFYETSDDGMRLYLSGSSTPVIDQWTYVGGAERTYTTSFASIGWVPIRIEHRETTGAASLNFSWSGPGFAKQTVTSEYFSPTLLAAYGNYGSDDNFAVLSTSPSIDAGDPAELYYREPMPNGGRINAGGSGNTTLAEISALQNMQVVSPNGLEKYEQGQTVSIDLRSHGLLPAQPVMLLNGGNTAVGVWSAGNAFQTSGLVSSVNNEFVTATIDRSAVTDPIPEQLYRSYLQSNFGVGNTLSLKLPVSDGTYSVRLHFIEGSQTAVGARRFDIRINGATVRANYDILATAGVRFKAVAESFTGMVASAGGGLSIDLVNLTGPQAILAAVEIFTATPQGTATPTAALELSSDGGTNWSPIAGAGAVTFDRWGTSTFNWTIPVNQAQGNNYRIRARAAGTSGEVTGMHDTTFAIANSGLNYYVSPSGDNLNSGKSSDQPMRSVSALINAYDLDAGDIVNFVGGNYRSYRNIILTPQDSGVTLRALPGDPVVINRGNVNSATRAIELAGADFVTLDGLRLTGGEMGLTSPDGVDSDDLTLIGSQFFGNSYAGIWIGSGNDRWNIGNNKIYGIPSGISSDDQTYGMIYNAAQSTLGHQITGNEIYDHPNAGIHQPPINSLIAFNDIHGNRYGINSSLSASIAPLIIRDNEIRDNTEYGLHAQSNGSAAIIVTGNKVYGQNGTNDVGMYIYGGTEATNNSVYGNYKGIITHSYDSGPLTRVAENRMFNNSFAAITVEGKALVESNYIYSNSIGIYALPYFYGTVAKNLVYANTNRGLLIQNSGNTALAEYMNNTIYQPVGDGIRIESSASNNRIVNNIVWVLSGYGMFVANDSQVGLQSDYNLFHQGDDPNAYVGSWNGVNRDTLAAWRAASSRDANSVEGSPGFVDIDGADNVLGYVATAGGIHGGLDDNFYRTKNSPAIDRGQTWGTLRTDIEGFQRVDDTAFPNQGGNRYVTSTVSNNVFGPASVGVAQNWNADDQAWTLALPFAFPFYGTSYSSVSVSSNGLLQFGAVAGADSANNGSAALRTARRIAALWDDLKTTGVGDNIFVDTSIASQATIRWNATNKANDGDVQFAVSLFSTGEIRLHYGSNNLGLTPTVGVSSGDAAVFTLTSYDGLANLENANSIQLQPVVDTGFQWASSVVGFSSQYSTGSWSAAQALGVPNTNSYGDIPTSWAPSAPNAGVEFITVGYTTPLYANGVTVRETLGNGFVTRIELLDVSDQYHVVWTGVDPSQPGTPVDFFVSFPTTSYLVKGVKVVIDTSLKSTYEEIDAIKLHGTLDSGNGLLPITATNLTSNAFYDYASRGVAQNWKSDDSFWTWNLPFAFPLYGTNYSSIYVSSNGFLQFGNTNNIFNSANSTNELLRTIRIAGLWDDLTTAGAADNIFLDTSVVGQATVRWDATNKANSGDVNFSITLFASGQVRFEYGPGNKQLSPTIGMSFGNGRDFETSVYDGMATLTNVSSQQVDIVSGITDIGAYEFRGRSDDTTAPRIVLSTPSALQNGGVVAGPISQLQLTFNEEINPIDARSPAAYELRGAGANNTFGDADDVVYVLTPTYVPGQNSVVLTAALSTGPLPIGGLPAGLYRMTVLASIASSIHDLSGNRLDGNADGNEGDNYVRQFKVTNNIAPTLSGLNPLTNILRDEPAATNPGTLVSQLLATRVTDPDGPGLGVAIAAATSSVGTWQYTLDGVTYQAIEPKLAGGKRLLLAADADTRIRFQPNAGFVGQAADLILSAWDRADELPEGLDVLATELSARSLSSQTATATIVVEPRNDAPTDIVLSNSSVLENLTAGATVGTLSAVDPNAADTHTYQLVSGTGSTDNDAFEIVAGAVKTKSGFNFEAKPTYSIRVRATDQGGLQIEKAMTISIVDLPELISGPVIGDGTAQRSMVKQIVVTFDQTVTIGAGAFIVTQRGGGVVTSSAAGVTNAQGQFVVTITFSGASTRNGALNDGYYQLNIDGTKLTRAGQSLDINQDGTGGDSLVIGDDEADNFFALYGDTNGDGLVGVAEFGQFRSAFGKTSSVIGYNILFDFEGDGSIGISDFGQFRSRFGKPKLVF